MKCLFGESFLILVSYDSNDLKIDLVLLLTMLGQGDNSKSRTKETFYQVISFYLFHHIRYKNKTKFERKKKNCYGESGEETLGEILGFVK